MYYWLVSVYVIRREKENWVFSEVDYSIKLTEEGNNEL